MAHTGTFKEIAGILGVASLLGFTGQKLKQPLIIMFLAAGILAGPSCLGLVKSYDQIELLAQIGIALLLFIVGLKLDLKLIKTTGPVALATGSGQIVFTAAIGFALAHIMGMSTVSSAYIAVSLTFSSTIIIVKLLSDKKEIDSLHGQIALGFLIVQDIAAIIALAFLTAFGRGLASNDSVMQITLQILWRGTVLVGLVGLLMRFVIPGLIQKLAHSQEMLSLFAVSWAVFLAAGGEFLGFSKEVGAFLAGISLASTDYRDAIGSRLSGLRDFLLLFFFIDLGARLDWSVVGSQLGTAAVFSIFVLIGKPVVLLIIMGLMGYRRRTSFMDGLTVAQISEFSLIVAALGVSLGHISAEVMGLITLVGVVTIFASSYMILHSKQLYNLLSEPLKIFERKNPYRETAGNQLQEIPTLDVILIGLGSYGSSLVEDLLLRKKNIMGVDFDPEALQKWRNSSISLAYGDISDTETFESLPLTKTRCVASTVHSEELNLELLQFLKERRFQGKVALTASNSEEARHYEEAGASIIFRPFNDAAEQAAGSLTHAIDVLPDNINWPIAFKDVKISASSSFASQALRQIPIRSITGVSVLAVIRGGQIYHEPGADFKIFPGDRVVIMGPGELLPKAEELLNKSSPTDENGEVGRFEIAEILIANGSAKAGQTLQDMKFRQAYGVTVVGIRRGEQQITAPSPSERLETGDCIIVIGTARAVEIARKQHQTNTNNQSADNEKL